MPHPRGGYKNMSGQRVPGVTTIIGRFKDSGGLLWWAFEQGKAAERGEISSLYDKRDAAADAGTIAHQLVEDYINGKPITEPSEKSAWQGFQNFLSWEKNNRIQIISQEMELVSEDYQFGGCPDAIGIDADNKTCLVDWKTSNGVYPDYLIQLAAYGYLWDTAHPDNKITGGYHLCRFSKENADFAHHYFNDLTDAWEQFKLFRAAYDLDKKLKKRV